MKQFTLSLLHTGPIDATTLIVTALRLMTLSIVDLLVIFSINDSLHNYTPHNHT